MVATVMTASSATLRWPGYMHNSLTGLLAALAPLPRCHLLMAAYTPLSPPQPVRCPFYYTLYDALAAAPSATVASASRHPRP